MMYAEYRYTNITTQTTTLVLTGKGTLHKIVINKPLASGVVGAYDGITAVQPIALITRPATLLNDAPVSVEYNVACSAGLTIVTSGANQDITICWSQG